jgi:hypothetical protein
MAQTEQIRKVLVDEGRISSWDAIQRFRITRLSAHILLLRKEGLEIKSTWKENVEGKRWVEYSLCQS